ncbi:MAG TPA: hypothetical protein VKP04_06690 [Ktedonobacteraceae bacterium]|nr:hypothetical protein [Ktedonobacteraceae bacterium]
MTTLQTVTPDHLSGRVISVQVLFFDGSLPLGYLLMGWLSGLCGAPIVMLIGAFLSLVVVGAGWRSVSTIVAKRSSGVIGGGVE